MSKSTKGNGRVAGLLIPDSKMTVLLEYISIFIWVTVNIYFVSLSLIPATVLPVFRPMNNHVTQHRIINGRTAVTLAYMSV